MAWAEKAFEEKMTPYIDRIYKGIFKNLYAIHRSDRETEQDTRILFMDRELAIDTFLYFNDGTVLTFQEKTRRKKMLERFGADFTFEYFNDPRKSEQGEWFKLAAQLYFYGYANEGMTGYDCFWIIDIAKLRLFLKNNIGIELLERKYLRQNYPPAKANFFAIPFSEIGGDCILCKYNGNEGLVKYSRGRGAA